MRWKGKEKRSLCGFASAASFFSRETINMELLCVSWWRLVGSKEGRDHAWATKLVISPEPSFDIICCVERKASVGVYGKKRPLPSKYFVEGEANGYSTHSAGRCAVVRKETGRSMKKPLSFVAAGARDAHRQPANGPESPPPLPRTKSPFKYTCISAPAACAHPIFSARLARPPRLPTIFVSRRSLAYLREKGKNKTAPAHTLRRCTTACWTFWVRETRAG